ncbi:hypothetical protein Cch01nite_23800 [Cellulomonas chitinilytica]|uniref:Uncharacterized protein n=2 Tax=Cellulomonas chitinilytica TaxID=398759 RepID=A0A919P1I2_9CELL|nr:hypothetical protein Cch01nite_23800 [Cellulomonas chitinilytica]
MTAPGVLTAVAALITAVGGVYGVYVSQHRDVSPSPTTTVVSDPDGVVVPAPLAPVDPATDEPPAVPATDPLTDPAGTDVVDGLAVLHDGTAPVDEGPTGTDPFAVWYAAADLDGRIAADDCGLGDLDACGVLEGILVSDCQVTFDAACDLLYLAEPAGSELEDLGATCGDLFSDWTSAGACTT